MSTRCNVEIYDGFNRESPGAMLYHHSDGYPSFMAGKLDRFLKAAYEYLTDSGYSYWWDSERVAAVLIALSIEDYTNPLKPFSTDRVNRYDTQNPSKEYRTDGGVPVFQPCLRLHGDIEYVWRVYLTGSGEFTVKCFRANHNGNGITVGSEVDLTKEEE
jgi:hypothetical protein